jgi:hypothetical protein
MPESRLISFMGPAVTSGGGCTVTAAYGRDRRKVPAVSVLGGGFLSLRYFLMLCSRGSPNLLRAVLKS